ncbi:nitroreductase family protein [Loigolactobacillus rennini]|uniref:Nitroreductase n=1 Tax=Loigolactobacillus rennini DSM 20253 TaxID=1423796 RepID=A0A0R2D4Y8_9LACO|nr:nitroreductase family protein [Loigolactobacillus rennini]KRM98498.1 nitroreductase [Loigolactobacillus rennini DSM 20253]
MADLEDILRQRHTVREFIPQQSIPKEELDDMITLASLAPSALNKQPLRYLTIDTPAARQQLLQLADFNQTQIKTASSLVLIAADLVNNDAPAFTAGNAPEKVAPTTLTNLALDAGLAGMQLMLVAQNRGYVTNVMTGFDHEHILSALKLDQKRYHPFLLIAIGKSHDKGQAVEHKSLNKILLHR